MAIEGYLISSQAGKEFLTKTKPEHFESLGRYLRVNNEVWVTSAEYLVNVIELLGLAQVSAEDFTSMFNAGRADARMYVFTNPELHNQDLQMKSFRFGRRVYSSFLLEKPKIRLCGVSHDLWTIDSKPALDKSVKIFRQEFSKYDVSSGKTVWTWMG